MLTKKDPVAGVRDRVQRDSTDGDYLIRRLDARQAEISNWYADLKYCVEHIHILNDWECDFILGLGGYAHPSERQRAKLAVVCRKVKLALTVGRRSAVR